MTYLKAPNSVYSKQTIFDKFKKLEKNNLIFGMIIFQKFKYLYLKGFRKICRFILICVHSRLNEISNDKNQINFYFQQIITIIQSNINFLFFIFYIESYMGDDTKNIILNYKKFSNFNFIITKDEEELQRKRNEEMKMN